MKRLLLVGAVALSVLLGGCAAQPGSAPQSQASTTPATASPVETAAPTIETKEQLIASLELSAEKYPDANSLAKAIMNERWTAWENQGATQENIDKFMNPNTNKSAEEFAVTKAEENADVFPKALFVKEYKTDPVFVHLVETETTVTKINAAVLERALITSKDSHPYERSMKISGEVTPISGSVNEKHVVFKFDWINSSNAAENKIGSKYDPDDVNPVTGTYTITAVVIDGKWKISNIQW